MVKQELSRVIEAPHSQCCCVTVCCVVELVGISFLMANKPGSPGSQKPAARAGDGHQLLAVGMVTLGVNQIHYSTTLPTLTPVNPTLFRPVEFQIRYNLFICICWVLNTHKWGVECLCKSVTYNQV